MDNEIPTLIDGLKRRSRRIATVVLIAMMPMFGGCYGSFPLTHALYEANGKISDNEIIVNIVFWIFAFFGIYFFASFGDAIIFNLIEFWSGKKTDISVKTAQGDTTVTLVPAADGNEMVLSVTRKGAIVSEEHFIKVTETRFEGRNAKNKLDMIIDRSPNGDLTFANAQGKTIRTIPAAALAAHAS